MGEGGLDDLTFFIRHCYLQYTNFVSLSDKKSVIVSPVFAVHISRQKREVKTVSVL